MKTRSEPDLTRHGAVAAAPLMIVGSAPPSLAQHFQSVPPPAEPELLRLPLPGERDPITSSSRSWLLDIDATLPANERFIFRIRQRGKLRGAVFINVSKLKSFFRKAEAAEHEEAEQEVAAV